MLTKTRGNKKRIGSFDRQLFSIAVALTFTGLIALLDASAPMALNNFGDKYYFVKQQFLWVVLGVFLMYILSRIKYSFWEKISVPFFALTIILLVLVFIPPFGRRIMGAKRWIFFPVTFQPSEIVKLSLAVYFAKLTSSKKNLLSYLVPLGLVAGLIMLEPDLGTTILISLIALSQIFVSGVNIAQFILAGTGTALLAVILILTSSYRRERLLTFFEQSSDPLGKSYHIRQILLALGAGGLFGVGLGQSRQKYLFLPEAATDSIFAVISEEVGFLGAGVLVIIFAYFILRSLKTAKNAPDDFSKSLCTGLVAWIGGQAFLNIASMVALVPLTGIPLPFFSYGGSSLVTVLMACGIILNISRYE